MNKKVTQGPGVLHRQYWLNEDKFFTDLRQEVLDPVISEDLTCPPNCGNCCKVPGGGFCALLEPMDCLHLWIRFREFMFIYVIPIASDNKVGRLYTKTEEEYCIFFNRHEKKCLIHPIRPRICHHFPFDKSSPPEFDCPLWDRIQTLKKRDRKKIMDVMKRRKAFTTEMITIYFEFYYKLLTFLGSFALYGLDPDKILKEMRKQDDKPEDESTL